MAYEIIVVNIKDPVPDGYFSVNIMSPNVLGSPFILADETKRDVEIGRYKEYLWKHMQDPDSIVVKALLKYAQTANNIALVCCCKPKKCHGDVVKAAIEWIRDNKNQWHISKKSHGVSNLKQKNKNVSKQSQQSQI